MKTRIAISTISGKAYHKLVNELKRRELPFLSLLPTSPIPLDVKVAITTEMERHLIRFHDILIFEDEDDPAVVIDKAVRMMQGKEKYNTLVIGVDPGKTFGLAAIGDRLILETITCHCSEDAASTIVKILKKFPTMTSTIKIGNGTPHHTNELLQKLKRIIPKDVIIEVVSEVGTSRFKREEIRRREARDAIAAVKIAERN